MWRRHWARACSRSNMLFLPKAGKDGSENGPLLAFVSESGPAIFLQGVIFAFAAIPDLNPAGFDPALIFHAVKDRVKHAVGPGELARGKGFDVLNQLVAIAFAAREEGKNDGFGRGGNEFFFEHGGIIHCVAMHVKRPIGFAVIAIREWQWDYSMV